MVDYHDISYAQKKEIRKAFEKSGFSWQKLISGEVIFPTDYVELILRYCYDYDDEELENADELEIAEKASDATIRLFLNHEEKKS